MSSQNISPPQEVGDKPFDGPATALKAAVAALYFDDNSDFQTALWCVVQALGGNECVELLVNRPSEAFKKYCESPSAGNPETAQNA